MKYTVEEIAKVCHEVNKSYCESLGDDSQPSWDEAPHWQKSSAINGVNFHIQNHNSKPSDSHDAWLAEKKAAGWKYGPIKDPIKKEHPCFVSFSNLPQDQQAKDFMFTAIVKTMSQF